ncbi:MAG TPA: DUF2382 domain-containing protein [Geminicoccus sp.]|jgi:uncharacterized protein (TIGR02271 family)|uniref:DUF2382 domain-containing protein n=1 Tax=Geminicoccus sp. TaxID=2024832 RepID=UPI002E358B73|nr:DUF2382 domain-containing protein [Geminicoccus sp.]HEX2529242.1 DUF2382 domain-containing protein [Geminicoccus sp.]
MAEPFVHHQHGQQVELLEERLKIDRRIVELGRTHVAIEVETRQQFVEALLHEEEVTVDRITIDQFVDEVPPVREEHGVLIVPVVEEQLVVGTRLVLKEELRIKKLSQEVPVRRMIPLRAELATVRRVDEPDLGPPIVIQEELP